MWGNVPRRARWVAAGYVAGFVEGTCSHTYSLLTGGVHAYSLAPVAIQVVFHAVLVLDALVVVLIMRANAAGPPMAAAVILADALANWWTQAEGVIHHPLRYLVPIGLLPITLFCVFVLVTAVPLRHAFIARQPAADRTWEQLV